MNKPCKRGHTGGRYPGGSCIECMALRKGKAGRKVPPSRGDKLKRAADRFQSVLHTVTKEDLKLKKEQATAERLKLKEENRMRRVALNTPLSRLRQAAPASLSIAVAPRPDALSELAPVPMSGPIAAVLPRQATPTHGDELLTRTVYDGDGVPRQEYVRDRNGNPVPAHKSVTAPAPQPKPADPPKPTAPTPVRVIVQPGFASDERLPPWVREGRQPTKAELAARHHQTEGPTGYRGDDWFIEACEARNRRGGGY